MGMKVTLIRVQIRKQVKWASDPLRALVVKRKPQLYVTEMEPGSSSP
jgi:hypothetical protein